MTSWTVDRLNETSQSAGLLAMRENWTSGNPGSMIGALKGFVGAVHDGGAWDYKGVITNSTGGASWDIPM